MVKIVWYSGRRNRIPTSPRDPRWERLFPSQLSSGFDRHWPRRRSTAEASFPALLRVGVSVFHAWDRFRGPSQRRLCSLCGVERRARPSSDNGSHLGLLSPSCSSPDASHDGALFCRRRISSRSILVSRAEWAATLNPSFRHDCSKRCSESSGGGAPAEDFLVGPGVYLHPKRSPGSRLSVEWLNEPFDPEWKSTTDFNNARMDTRKRSPTHSSLAVWHYRMEP